MAEVERAIERAFRQESGQVLATLIGWSGDFELAEDSLQDALVAALERWRESGIPARPGAWMTAVARRKLVDRLRRESGARRAARMGELAAEPAAPDGELERLDEIPDERLKLIFTCCHPALPQEAQVALTLTALGGLTTAEAARAFLVPVPTMAQRLVRARRKIRDAGIPFEIPPAHRMGERLDVVLQAIYLIFTEGYGASQGDELIRRELCEEAIRLGRVLCALTAGPGGAGALVAPAQRAESLGLLALMLLHHARRDARVDGRGLVLLADQDRTRWDRAQIATGLALLDTALAMRSPGPYQIQAAISALHAEAPSADATDWPQIAALYGQLLQRSSTPVVEINRAVAVGMAYGPEAGLALLEGIAGAAELRGYYPLHLARAAMLRRAGRAEEARASYRAALDGCQNAVEREAISRQLAELG